VDTPQAAEKAIQLMVLAPLSTFIGASSTFPGFPTLVGTL
jgi:hypothetical protein